MPETSIKNLSYYMAVVKNKTTKKVIVFGSFDPLHKGHLDFFRQAKELGDFLVVVVARDEQIIRTKKKELRIKESERLKAIEKLPMVDKIILGDKVGEYKILEKEKPDIIGIGYDQIIPEELKNELKKYKMIRLKPYKPEKYKSTLVHKVKSS